MRVLTGGCHGRRITAVAHGPPTLATAIYNIVSRRLRALDIRTAHLGPHALLHSCAVKPLADKLTNSQRDLYPQERAHAGRTDKKSS